MISYFPVVFKNNNTGQHYTVPSALDKLFCFTDFFVQNFLLKQVETCMFIQKMFHNWIWYNFKKCFKHGCFFMYVYKQEELQRAELLLLQFLIPMKTAYLRENLKSSGLKVEGLNPISWVASNIILGKSLQPILFPDLGYGQNSCRHPHHLVI